MTPVKRYLLFSGSSYYPCGGWDDFRGDYDSRDAAIGQGAKSLGDWFHVVDLETGKEVFPDQPRI
jgi:hypothetical protein